MDADRAMCGGYQKRVEAWKEDKNVTREQKLDAMQVLEELKSGVERQDEAVIREKRGLLEHVLKSGR